LDLDSRGGGYAQINQFSMKETECGESKVTFEDYLHRFINQEQHRMLLGDTEED
jgi:hypothetical protein